MSFLTCDKLSKIGDGDLVSSPDNGTSSIWTNPWIIGTTQASVAGNCKTKN